MFRQYLVQDVVWTQYTSLNGNSRDILYGITFHSVIFFTSRKATRKALQRKLARDWHEVINAVTLSLWWQDQGSEDWLLWYSPAPAQVTVWRLLKGDLKLEGFFTEIVGVLLFFWRYPCIQKHMITIMMWGVELQTCTFLKVLLLTSSFTCADFFLYVCLYTTCMPGVCRGCQTP